MDKERPQYNEKRQQVVEFGIPFRPFEKGFTRDADFDLPTIKKAYGYSPTFIIPQVGKGRVEVFTDPHFVLKAEIAKEFIETFDEEKYKYHDVLPVVPIPVIYFDDPETVDPNITCRSQLRNIIIDGINNGEPGYNELAIFPMWDNENIRNIAEFKFYTEEDLQNLVLTFNRDEDEYEEDEDSPSFYR